MHAHLETVTPPEISRETPVERITDSLKTPPSDDRLYRVIRLSNQLEILLIHDAFTDVASAAMDVNVGNFSDPRELFGMAHAVEHLLFMGNKKYPVENEYSSYLSMHSGTSNAYTASTSTNYYFELGAKPINDAIDTSPLYGALDRFAQFFIEPLFLSSTLERELHAVDSEYKKNLQSDAWRLSQLDKSLSNSKHPYHQFSTGNLATLKLLPETKGIDMRLECIKFHEKYYSANRMKLVVLGKEPLDTLEEWVADLFTGVQNKDLPQNRWEDEHPIGKEQLLTQYFAKPIMDFSALDLYFPFLDEEDLLKSPPSSYICHLIGHEGPGSIMAYIKSKGWANSLGTIVYLICPGTTIFNCQIRLTESGLNHYQDIVKVFFQYISLIRDTIPQEWIFQEQKAIRDVAFRFRQRTPAADFTSKLSAVMQKAFPRQWLLSMGTLQKFDHHAIQEGLDFLRADNFRMSLVSQKLPVELDQTERWYGIEYKNEKIPTGFLTELKKAETSTDRLSELHLPHKNLFIPMKLDIDRREVTKPLTTPALIRNDELARAWFKKDDTFWIPKTNLFISCRNPLVGATAAGAVKSQIYTELVKDILEEYSYDAELAGLQYDVSCFLDGLDIQVTGYTDKLPILLEKVLITMRDLPINSNRFEVIKERFTRGLQNWYYEQPYKQIGNYSRWLQGERGYNNEQQLTELPKITVEDIQSHFPPLLHQMHFETLVHGNMCKEDAQRLTNLVESTFQPRPLLQWPIRRSLIFPPGANYTYHRKLKDTGNLNHCVEYLLHIGDRADRTLASKARLLDQIMHEAVNDQLRTREQLGYIVFSSCQSTATTIGYHFTIQSEKTPQYLETRIDAFLTHFISTIEDMSRMDFESHKSSLVTKQLEKVKNLREESGRYWQHIESEYFDFEAAYRGADLVKGFTQRDMIEFFKRYILPASPTRAKLTIHLHAQGTVVAPETQSEINIRIEDPSEQNKQRVEKKAELSSIIRTASTPYLIKNVQEFKSRLSISAGPQPVKSLSEFEDTDQIL